MQPNWRTMVGHKSYDDLWNWAVQRLQAMGSRVVTNLNWGPFRILLSLFLEAVSVVYDYLADVLAPSGFTQYATGDWLDLGVQDRGVERREAIKTEGNVVFARLAAGGPIQIPAGSLVKTDLLPSGESLVYITTTETILPDGALEVTVPVKAEFAGSIYNVSDGAIKHMVTHIPGVDSVTNRAGWLTLEGADVETDDQLRARGKLVWHSLSNGGTDGYYRARALEVPGVVEAVLVTGEPRGPGTLDIIITSTTGLPTAQLLSSVQEHIDAKKPLLDNVVVKAPTTKAIDITVEMTLPPVGGDEVAIKAEAEDRVQALFTLDSARPEIVPLVPGQGLYLSQLIWLLRMDWVENVKVTAPAVDESAVAGQLLTLGILTVTVVRRA